VPDKKKNKKKKKKKGLFEFMEDTNEAKAFKTTMDEEAPLEETRDHTEEPKHTTPLKNESAPSIMMAENESSTKKQTIKFDESQN